LLFGLFLWLETRVWGSDAADNDQITIDAKVSEKAKLHKFRKGITDLALEIGKLRVAAAGVIPQRDKFDRHRAHMGAVVGMQGLRERFAAQLAALLPVQGGLAGFAIKPDQVGIKPQRVMLRRLVVNCPCIFYKGAEVRMAFMLDLDSAGDHAGYGRMQPSMFGSSCVKSQAFQ
jgi:hypothetical protein